VFSIFVPGALKRVVLGEDVGTLVLLGPPSGTAATGETMISDVRKGAEQKMENRSMR
jgi:hypothetical protein